MIIIINSKESFISYAAIQQEKGKQQLISGIENFDPAKLKHAETLEKNPLPTKEGLYAAHSQFMLLYLFEMACHYRGNIVSAIDAEKIAA